MLKRPDHTQRRELGAFLSAHRARRSPDEFGLPTGIRRTPGLRREEVASLAGVSVSWYTWLEQGRDIHPSADALERIAKVLKLDRIETGHLLALAARTAAPDAIDTHVSEGLHALLRIIDPTPAYIRNARLDVLAWNDAIAGLFVDYGALAPHERNTLRLLFLYPAYRTLILEWEQMARGMISTFRAARAQARNKAPFDALVAELNALSPEFRAWWPQTDVRGFDEGSKRLRHPLHGDIGFTYVALVPEGRPDLSLVTYIANAPGRDRRS